ncbi:uncharacterized protein DUF1826 [Leptospira meyeri]|uniref:Uncharacterized protein DUF1826 n=1 Tax=Leptospira meyeri TaxID=29508 RepID=A0A4R8MV46_LEPME|nr:DUF1826 domain-containing protein [Leptospira meyeri]EKJ84977.1 PF08856 family protein [Leptospira meyeri serovar Hardjo str. Went 5]TDY72008.1 uncharacterized protein DUF1826 [Leptospira meyeri]TGL47707.1 DUF1826 domain-containing protein [Leptospira meyeri]
MNSVYEVIENFSISNNKEVLFDINRKGINIAIWKRSPSRNIINYLDILSKIKNFSLQINSKEVQSIDKYLPIHYNRTVLDFAKEMLQLSNLFAMVTGLKEHNLHISTIETTQCPLYHVDFLSYRMICTYIGPSTQWIPNFNADRNHLGCGRNNHLVKDFRLVRETENFDVILMKGDTHPNDPNNGCIHKSPEIINGSRIFIRIDGS